jgi:hypothetical protein
VTKTAGKKRKKEREKICNEQTALDRDAQQIEEGKQAQEKARRSKHAMETLYDFSENARQCARTPEALKEGLQEGRN